MADDKILEALRRIASALSLPVSAFYEQCGPSTVEPAAQAVQEKIELLEAFAQIRDPQTRRECPEFIQARAWDRRGPSK